eukprot:CAMPEP_0182593484 /NCGR_PEP_ID=MMETSP1324-20130603/78092_1 /TAXON_ID=236786 /ORGANISM="Florenciella sp., Strain RCC1587" /LENGTH=139 /DNA_ID=CAMNT_0024810951 /DNA_START=318 /DNA_END=735 /DNA_ORIENTATION=-
MPQLGSLLAAAAAPLVPTEPSTEHRGRRYKPAPAFAAYLAAPPVGPKNASIDRTMSALSDRSFRRRSLLLVSQSVTEVASRVSSSTWTVALAAAELCAVYLALSLARAMSFANFCARSLASACALACACSWSLACASAA